MMPLTSLTATEMVDGNCIEERPCFFRNQVSGSRLYGIHYQPSKPTGTGMVFLHPVGPERIIGDTVPVNVARALAAIGVTCLRFDYTGTGDSEGDFKYLTKSTILSDIDAAVAEIRSNNSISRVGLFGFRFGGMLARLYAERYPDRVDGLILCAPVIDFKDFINRALMVSITCQPLLFGKVIFDRESLIQRLEAGTETSHEGINLCNLDGFPLTQGFWKSFSDCNLLQDEVAYRKQCLVIGLNIPGKKKDDAVLELVNRYGEDGCYMELLVKYLPWIHNTNCLISSIADLNECVTKWTSARL